MKQQIRLREAQSKLLSKLPEQGMGYQIVDVELKDGIILEKLFVIDCTILVVENHFEKINPQNILSIKLHN